MYYAYLKNFRVISNYLILFLFSCLILTNCSEFVRPSSPEFPINKFWIHQVMGGHFVGRKPDQVSKMLRNDRVLLVQSRDAVRKVFKFLSFNIGRYYRVSTIFLCRYLIIH